MSKSNRIGIFIITSLLISLFNHCGKSPSQPETPISTEVAFSGQVIDFDTGQPISNAAVKIIADSVYGVATDATGNFTKTIRLSKSMDVFVIASKENYTSDTLIVFAVPGRTINVPQLKIKRISSTTVSGSPASIVLVRQTYTSIGVRESGQNETTTLTFEVRDSSGNPIDINKAVTVNFYLGANPGGGLFIHPPSRKTNSLGQASVNVTSGTKAGIVQIIAEVNTETNLIRSKPVSVAIHGGLPDHNHFSLAPEKLNFPGLVSYGLSNKISAYVGDKYSNPVKPGTVVYFSTTGGIIEGSATTDEIGRATVQLISARPEPIHPNLGPGFASVTAFTANENNQIITRQIAVLFSGPPEIMTISPTSFNISNGGSQFFVYTVSDGNGNPLASGNTISVKVEGNVKAQGDVSVNLPDTQSRSWTHFSFTVTDSDPDEDRLEPVTITIEVDGPNGKNKISITGTSR